MENYAISHMSLAHTIGNVTSFVREYLLGLFPKDYFNGVTVSSTVAYRYFNIFDNTNKEFFKWRKPMLIIRPRLDPNEETFLQNTFLTNRITDNYMDLGFSNLQPFFMDQQRGIHIRYLLNRMKLNFDVTIIMDQQMEQINKFYYLKNVVRQDHPFNMNTFLESNIHHSMVRSIAKEVGIDPDDSVAVLEYMNSHSAYPMTYKMKNSTGNDEYFRYYPAILDTMFTNLNMDEGSKRGFLTENYTISFTLTTEFYTSGLYYLFSTDKNTISRVEIGMKEDKAVIPVHTIDQMFDFIKVPAGWNLYSAPMFGVSVDRGSDRLDLSDKFFASSLIDCIEYHKKNGIPLTTMIKFIVFKDEVRLEEENGDYSFDWNDYHLTVNRVNRTSTYRLLVYVNTLYINKLVAQIHNIDEER